MMRRLAVVLAILLRSALRGLQRGAVTTGVAIATIGVALLLVGAFALLVVNMQGMLDRFGGDLKVVAYLADDLDERAAAELAERVATIEGVASVVRVSRDEALDRFRARQGGAALLEGLEGNPLPSSLEIALLPAGRTPEGLAILRSALDGLPGIDEVAHGQEWVEGYARAASLVRSSSFALGAVLTLAALLIVANTIRLAVYAREDELEILALVGASRTFVRVPFLLEGTIQGALGGLVSLAGLWVVFEVWVPQVQYGLAFFMGNAAPRFFDVGEMTRLVLAGAGLGLVGSITALLGGRS